MTVKELAEVAGVSDDTITRCARELFPGYVKRGKKTVFKKDQAFDIMTVVRKKNLVSPLPQNAEVVPQNAEVVGFIQQMMVQQQQFMTAMLSEIRGISSGQLQIEGPKQDYYSLVGFCRLKSIKTVVSELPKFGMDLRNMTKAAGLEIRKIPDERWGHVNSYPLEILEEYFTP